MSHNDTTVSQEIKIPLTTASVLLTFFEEPRVPVRGRPNKVPPADRTGGDPACASQKELL